MKRPRIGVLLLNLGGPERLEDVRPFLYNLFSDPAILRIRSRILRNALAWLIAVTRTRTSQGYYAKIGGGSPLRRLTEEQAAALRARLAERGLHEPLVYVGMSCWTPRLEEALARASADGIGDLVVLPLYPQFSTTTTGSALEAIARVADANGSRARQRVVRQWFDHPGYIAALAETIREEIARFPNPSPAKVHLLYTAHSIPKRLVDEGDPYLEQTRATVAAVNRELGESSPWSLGFQSRVGPIQWLEPATEHVIADLGARRTAQVLAIPVSFVSDHVETLYEIDILYREQAMAAGIGEFRRPPALNSRARFIDALADVVLGALRAPSTT